jgi:hypothetical protein
MPKTNISKLDTVDMAIELKRRTENSIIFLRMLTRVGAVISVGAFVMAGVAVTQREIGQCNSAVVSSSTCSWIKPISRFPSYQR